MSTHPAFCGISAPHVTLAAILLVILATPARPDKGRWTAPEDWGGADGIDRHAIHLVLLRGDGAPDHSRLVYWHTSNPTHFYGQELGWSPGNDDCALATGIGFTDRGSPIPPFNVFCAGHTQLAGAGTSGQVLVHGGTIPSGASIGERRCAVFTAGSGTAAGTWTETGSMFDGRWYPSAVALIDGRALALAGQRYPNLRVFAGLRNGALPASVDAEGDSVLRFGLDPGGRWDPSVLPAADTLTGTRPDHRWRHSLANMENVAGFGGQVFFGGLRDLAATDPVDDGWILGRSDGPVQAGDYQYQWTRVYPGTRPLPRSDHSAVVRDNEMILFGGRKGDGIALDDVWRLRKPGALFIWEPMTITGSIPARYGHAAVYDTFTTFIGGSGTFMKRMFVFGGVADGETPTDTKVYELRFDLSNASLATWYEHTPPALGPEGTPTARYWHTLNMDWTRVSQYSPTQTGHVALAFGGKRGNETYSDELWELWLFRDGTMGWKRRTWGGPAPSARALHSAAYFGANLPGRERLYINGGELQGGVGDAIVYAIDPRSQPPVSPAWQQLVSAEAALAGHAAAFEDKYLQSRIGEVYNAGTGQWFTDAGATLYQNNYPVSFQVPGRTVDGGRVYTFGTDNKTYYLDVPPQGVSSTDWEQLSIPALGFTPEAGVMYQPGKIMVSSGETRTLDTGNLSNPWQTSGSMIPRGDHNLVILPDGKVLAVGGTNLTPVFRPQLWNPATGQWTDTLLSNPDRLPAQQVVRGYHSTAVLLPDGRVLSAGSWFEPRAEIFCPPYLFNANGTPATRPVATGSPQRVRYGAQFSVCLSSVGTISSACLIRPGATTHAFDQNQRYVPLTFTQTYAPARLVVTAPADSAIAPPGDYLLFVLNTNGVPSIARWVRLGFAWSEGDVTPPGTISLVADFVTNNAVNLTWVASGDDGATGTAAYAELRWSTSPIITETEWANAAWRANPPPVPTCGGLGQQQLITGLQPHTTYYFAIRTSDESGNLSGFSQLQVTTLNECCSGEARARLVSGEEGSAGGEPSARGPAAPARSAPIASPFAAVPAGAGTGLMLEAMPVANGMSVKLVVIEGKTYGGYPLSTAGGVLLQSEEALGEWATQVHYDLPPGARFALYTPEHAARWVILEPCAVEKVLTGVRGQDAALILRLARSSRAGDITSLVAGGTPPALLLGDTLTLTYELVDETAVGRSRWVLVMQRPSGSATASRARGGTKEDPAQVAFTLHQNQPNPFRTATTIGFTLPAAGRVRLEVFDLLGRRVRSLADAQYPTGEHQVVWDRVTTTGSFAQAGVYYYVIEAGAKRDRKRMVLLP